MSCLTFQTLSQILTRDFRCPPEAIHLDSDFGDLGLHAPAERADFVSAAEDALRLRLPAAPLETPAGWTLGRMCRTIDELMARDARA